MGGNLLESSFQNIRSGTAKNSLNNRYTIHHRRKGLVCKVCFSNLKHSVLDSQFPEFLFETHEYQLIAPAPLWINDYKSRGPVIAQQLLKWVHCTPTPNAWAIHSTSGRIMDWSEHQYRPRCGVIDARTGASRVAHGKESQETERILEPSVRLGIYEQT